MQDPNTHRYWRATYDSTSQNTAYNGSETNMATGAVTPYQGTTKDNIKNTEFTYATPISQTEYIYTGIGIHNWDRDLLGASGYLEQYSWKYIPIGYRSEFKMNDKWDAAIDVAVKFPVNATLNTSGGTYDSQQFTLGNKPGFKAEIPFTYKMSSQLSLAVTPWYEYSAISQSNTVPLTLNGVSTGWVTDEPNSNTHQYGVDIGVAYNF